MSSERFKNFSELHKNAIQNSNASVSVKNDKWKKVSFEEFSSWEYSRQRKYLARLGFVFNRRSLKYDKESNKVILPELNPFTGEPAKAVVHAKPGIISQKMFLEKDGFYHLKGELEIRQKSSHKDDFLVFLINRVSSQQSKKQRQLAQEVVKRGIIAKDKAPATVAEKSEICFGDFVTIENRNSCLNKKHQMEDINAKVNLLTRSGKVVLRSVAATYCHQCKKYFIGKWEYDQLKQEGILMCRVVTDFEKKSNGYYENQNEESFLYQAGYSVSSNRDLTTAQRQGVLVCLMESGVPKVQISQHLNWLIKQRTGMNNMKCAIEKWTVDRDFVEQYKLGERRAVYVNVIRTKIKK